MKTEEIESINPSLGEKFSPNLHAFLKRQPKIELPHDVYREPDGALWIGYKYDGDFIGARLNYVLCAGAKSDVGCFTTLSLSAVPDFWSEYKAVGRCAIDRTHSVYYLNADSRYTESGDDRTCNWCGLRQAKRITREVIDHVSWVPMTTKETR